MIPQMKQLLEYFRPYCQDHQTIDRLLAIIGDKDKWPKAYSLFNDIRYKTLSAIKASNKVAEAQYLFEEACAKSIYNLTRPSTPFDTDSPFWVVPNAVAFAAALEVDHMPIIKIFSGNIR